MGFRTAVSGESAIQGRGGGEGEGAEWVVEGVTGNMRVVCTEGWGEG